LIRSTTISLDATGRDLERLCPSIHNGGLEHVSVTGWSGVGQIDETEETEEDTIIDIVN
jgi:hypothetical protein